LGLVFSLPDLKNRSLKKNAEIENQTRKKSLKESGLLNQNRGGEQNFHGSENFSLQRKQSISKKE